MRRSLLGALVVLGFLASADKAQAQFNSNDPLFTYYGIFLPRQQAQALQPGPEASIANITANRQAYASTNRNDAFDFSGNTSFDSETGEFTSNGGARRPPGMQKSATIGGNLNGFGPAKYYGTKAKPYHPTLRAGLHKNYNVGIVRTGRGFSASSSSGYGGVGLPGPR